MSSLGNGSGLTALIDIKTESVAQSDVSGMDAGQIMDILHGLDLDGVRNAAEAHLALSDKLEQVATRLAGNAHTLAQSWQGTAAQAAMAKFQVMHDQTATLAAQAKQTGQVLNWLGNEVLPKYKDLPDPRVESRTASDEQTGAKVGDEVAGAPGALAGDVIGGVASMFHLGSNGQAKANAQAQQYLTALNEHLIQANNALPSPIGAPGPSLGTGSGNSPARGASAGAGAGAGAGNSNVPTPVPVMPGGGTGPTGGARGTLPPVGRLSGASPGHLGTSTGTAGLGSTGGSGSVPSTGSLQGNPVGSLQGFPATGGPTPLPAGGPAPVPTGPVPGGGATLPGMPVPGGLLSGGRNGEPTDGELPADAALPDAALPGEAAGAGVADAGVADDALPGLEGTGVLGANSAGANSAVLGTATNGAAANGATDAAGASTMGAGDAADSELAVFPFGAGSAGNRDKERRREAWMDEDADTWGFPAQLVPAVIEGGG